MKENIRLRLWGAVYLGMLILNMLIVLANTDFLVQALGFLSGGCFLIAFLIINYRVYRLETRKGKMKVDP